MQSSPWSWGFHKEVVPSLSVGNIGVAHGVFCLSVNWWVYVPRSRGEDINITFMFFSAILISPYHFGITPFRFCWVPAIFQVLKFCDKNFHISAVYCISQLSLHCIDRLLFFYLCINRISLILLCIVHKLHVCYCILWYFLVFVQLFV